MVILTLCALLGAGVAATTLVAIWSTRRANPMPTVGRQSVLDELVWAAIPCLMLLAAAIPALVALVSTSTGE